MELLLELIDLVHARPDTTGVLLEHFAERDRAAALQKLAMQDLPGDEDGWRQEILDAAVQLEKQMLQQRLDELQAKQRSMGLDEADKYELRTLLQAASAATEESVMTRFAFLLSTLLVGCASFAAHATDFAQPQPGLHTGGQPSQDDLAAPGRGAP